MASRIENQLEELNTAGVIDAETALKIKDYFQSKEDHSHNRQLLVFSILGSVLVGLGIILIVAHNWDDFSRTTKSLFAFMPLIIGQAACLFTLLRKRDNEAWCESSATFLFFAIGASIALISQIYNLPGDMAGFLFIWMILSLPLIYLLRSSVTSLLYIAGITWYACVLGYWGSNNEIPWMYTVLIIAILPHYYLLAVKKAKSNFTHVHHWILPLSLIIMLGAWSESNEELLFISYTSLFSLFFLLGYIFHQGKDDFFNSYQLLGSAGILILFLIFSFQGGWAEIVRSEIVFNEIILSIEFWNVAIMSLAASGVLIWSMIKTKGSDYNITGFAFIIFILAFILAYRDPFYSVLLINLFLFSQGVLLVRHGALTNHLGILNYGLVIITTLIICRFFDVKISFIIRGLIFLAVGFSFFMLNYRTIKNKRTV